MKTLIDLTKHQRPAAITPDELRDKLAHLAAVLEKHGKHGILIAPEGAMRWLTGTRHQIIDIAPDASSPVQALVTMANNGFRIDLVTTPIEMPRIKADLPKVFEPLQSVSIGFTETLPRIGTEIAAPGQGDYSMILGEIVRPLIGGFAGNQFKKLEWLSCMETALLADAAHRIEPGMNAAQVRGLIFHTFAEYSIETNLILVALAGQEGFLHPLWDENYTVRENSWMKLVSGGRFADIIVSDTVMVNIGGSLSANERAVYRALQESIMEYADCYRSGAIEGNIYAEVGSRFQYIEEKSGITGFGKSAYLHHLGGPTSPLGNRDYIIGKDGSGTMFPQMQFSINPVDCFHSFKVEIQGIVRENKPPFILDYSQYTPSDLLAFTEITSRNGTTGRVAELIVR